MYSTTLRLVAVSRVWPLQTCQKSVAPCSATSVRIIVVWLLGNAKGLPASPATLVSGLTVRKVVCRHVMGCWTVLGWNVMGVPHSTIVGPCMSVIVRGQCPVTIVGHEASTVNFLLCLLRKAKVLPVT